MLNKVERLIGQVCECDNVRIFAECFIKLGFTYREWQADAVPCVGSPCAVDGYLNVLLIFRRP